MAAQPGGRKDTDRKKEAKEKNRKFVGAGGRRADRYHRFENKAAFV